MGLFSFIKDAGKKIFGSKEEQKAENPAITEQQVTLNQKDKLTEFVNSHGLNVENFDMQFHPGIKVVMNGNAASKADYEKASLIAGNIAGVAEVDNQMTIGGQAEVGDSQLHTVEKGDTLWAISEKFYSDGSKYPTIVEANQPMIKDADEIYPGQVLRIPALG